MRIGCFEVKIIDASENAFPEIITPIPRADAGAAPNGTPIAMVEEPVVLATPGEQYKVKINVYRDADGNFPAQRLKAYLAVDGHSVGYCKTLDLTNSNTSLPRDQTAPYSLIFDGFLCENDDIRSFVFGKADVVEAQHATPGAAKAGTIVVQFFEAIKTGRLKQSSGAVEAPLPPKQSEDKKFWQQASATTEPGQVVRRIDWERSIKYQWERMHKHPVQVLKLKYHTRDMVDFFRREKDKQSAGRISEGSAGVDVEATSAVIDLTDDIESESMKIKREGLVSIIDLTDLTTERGCSSGAVPTRTGQSVPSDTFVGSIGVGGKRLVSFIDLTDKDNDAEQCKKRCL